MAATAQSRDIGEHPLTGELVSHLRRSDVGLAFTGSDITRFRNAGSALDPDGLLRWVRDLTVLAITLRNDMLSHTAANQVERELIDPLCEVLDQHVTKHADHEERMLAASNTARKQPARDTGPGGAMTKASALVGASIRPRSKRSDA